MKKITATLLAILLSSLCLMAQKATQAEINASKIIGMTNSVVDLYNSYLPHMKKVREGLSRAEQNIEVLAENINRSAHSWNCSYILMRDDQMNKYEKESKAAPTFPEKTKIQAQIKYIKANTDRLSNNCKALNDYFIKKQYKEDEGFKTYKVLYDSLEIAYKDISKSWSTAISLASDAGDRSEIVLLKKSPVAQFIIPMKTDMASASKILDKFTEDEVDYNAIVKDIEALRVSAEKNRDLKGKNVANLKKYSSEPNYGGFYKTMDDFIERAIKLEGLMNPEKVQEDSGNELQSKIQTTYTMLRDKYTSLVETYNIM